MDEVALERTALNARVRLYVFANNLNEPVCKFYDLIKFNCSEA